MKKIRLEKETKQILMMLDIGLLFFGLGVFIELPPGVGLLFMVVGTPIGYMIQSYDVHRTVIRLTNKDKFK